MLITTRKVPNLNTFIDRKLEGLNSDAARRVAYKKARDLGVKLHSSMVKEILGLTHGIPKLIEIAVSLSKSLSIEAVRDQLTKAKMPFDQSDKVFGYLFDQSWNELSRKEKRTLLAMAFFTEYATDNALKNIACMKDREFHEAVQKLHAMSLIDARDRSDGTKVYSIHPLVQKLCEAQLDQDAEFEQSTSEHFVNYWLRFLKENFGNAPTLVEREIKNLLSAIRLAKNKSFWELLVEFRTPINRFLWKSGYWRYRADVDHYILEACFKLENIELAASVLVEDLGFTYLRFEDLVEAERHVIRGLELFKTNKNQPGIALAIRHLGKLALLRGEYEQLKPGRTWESYFQESQQYYSDSLIIRSSRIESDAQRAIHVADLKLDFGRLFWLWGRKHWQRGGQLNGCIVMQKTVGYYDQAVSVSYEAISIFEKLENEEESNRGVAKAWGNIGNVHKERGRLYIDLDRVGEAKSEFKRAENAFKKSLMVAEKIQKADEVAHANWGLGELFEIYANESPLMRKDYLRKALQYASRSHDIYNRMETPYDEMITGNLYNRVLQKLQ